jgi:hypothetical protein
MNLYIRDSVKEPTMRLKNRRLESTMMPRTEKSPKRGDEPLSNRAVGDHIQHGRKANGMTLFTTPIPGRLSRGSQVK